MDSFDPHSTSFGPDYLVDSGTPRTKTLDSSVNRRAHGEEKTRNAIPIGRHRLVTGGGSPVASDICFALASPIGLDRERSERLFGMRTFPLVAVVSCGFMMVGMSGIESTDGEARVFQGIITGIGLIGGGAIFRDKDRVAGTASAASIWNTGRLG